MFPLVLSSKNNTEINVSLVFILLFAEISAILNYDKITYFLSFEKLKIIKIKSLYRSPSVQHFTMKLETFITISELSHSFVFFCRKGNHFLAMFIYLQI